MMKWILLFLAVAGALVGAGVAQQISSLSQEDAQSLGLTFAAAPDWRQGSSDPYSATTNSRGVSVYFYTELYTASTPGTFDSQTTQDVMQGKWRDSLLGARLKNISAGSADGVEAEWVGNRVERWFRVSNDRFVVERCMTNNVTASVWTSVVRPECDAQYNAVVLTASTLPPTYRASEPAPKVPAPEMARIPGGRCSAASGASESARAASLLAHGERAEAPADQFACWEAASQLGSADAMTKIGQLFLERDQLHQSEQDRMAGVVWLLVAADRYTTLVRMAPGPDSKARYQQRFHTIMDLVAAIKSEKLTVQQFDTAVTEASNWKKSNMHLFR